MSLPRHLHLFLAAEKSRLFRWVVSTMVLMVCETSLAAKTLRIEFLNRPPATESAVLSVSEFESFRGPVRVPNRVVQKKDQLLSVEYQLPSDADPAAMILKAFDWPTAYRVVTNTKDARVIRVSLARDMTEPEARGVLHEILDRGAEVREVQRYFGASIEIVASPQVYDSVFRYLKDSKLFSTYAIENDTSRLEHSLGFLLIAAPKYFADLDVDGRQVLTLMFRAGSDPKKFVELLKTKVDLNVVAIDELMAQIDVPATREVLAFVRAFVGMSSEEGLEVVTSSIPEFNPRRQEVASAWPVILNTKKKFRYILWPEITLPELPNRTESLKDYQTRYRNALRDVAIELEIDGATIRDYHLSPEQGGVLVPVLEVEFSHELSKEEIVKYGSRGMMFTVDDRGYAVPIAECQTLLTARMLPGLL